MDFMHGLWCKLRTLQSSELHPILDNSHLFERKINIVSYTFR